MQIISLKTHGKRTLQIASRISASLLVLALGFPASASGPDQPASTNLRPVKRFKRWIQVGQASWYGLKFQGRKTATGESYDMNQLTCAHRSLPLGSWVRVTNLKNKKIGRRPCERSRSCARQPHRRPLLRRRQGRWPRWHRKGSTGLDARGRPRTGSGPAGPGQDAVALPSSAALVRPVKS